MDEIEKDRGRRSPRLNPFQGAPNGTIQLGKEVRKRRRLDGRMEIRNKKKTMNEKLGLLFRSTWDIIEAVEKGYQLKIED